MSCIMKYRAKGSNKEWKFYEDGDERHCTDYLIDCEFEEDMEYEIYEFSSDGIVHGVYEYNDEEYETKLEYLLRIYECEDIESLKNKLPININLINLDSIVTDEFKEALSEFEIKEDKKVYKISGLDKEKKEKMKKMCGVLKYPVTFQDVKNEFK